MEEEIQETIILPYENQLSPAVVDYRANVDTSRPFRSVKEAVAIFGERFLAREVYSPSRSASKPPFSFPKHETPFFSSPHNDVVSCAAPSPQRYSAREESPPSAAVADALRRLEAELEETKAELKQLRERESETEVALASLNAELHKNMSKLAQTEAASAAKAAAAAEVNSRSPPPIVGEEIKKPSLAEILELRAEEEKKKKKKMTIKKKPIIPLVGDIFMRKKGSSPIAMNNPLFSSSHAWLN